MQELNWGEEAAFWSNMEDAVFLGLTPASGQDDVDAIRRLIDVSV